MRLLNRSVNGVAGRLSRRRRGPLAGLMVLLLGLILTGTVYAAFSPATAQKAGKSDEQLIQQGRELFLVGCAFCHGQNGEGVETDGENEQLGPRSLHRHRLHLPAVHGETAILDDAATLQQRQRAPIRLLVEGHRQLQLVGANA